MQVYYDIENLKLKKSVVVLGNFDGIHKGHSLLIDKAAHFANKIGGKLVMLTFYPHPLQVFKKNIKLINTDVEKRELAKKRGVDIYIRMPFIDKYINMSPEDFIKQILLEKLDTKGLVVGRDYRFGKKAKGDVNLLAKYATASTYNFYPMDKLAYKGRIISSTWIRQALKDGDILLANNLLASPYMIMGMACLEKETYMGENVRQDKEEIILKFSPDKVLPKAGGYKTILSYENYNIDTVTYINNIDASESSDNLNTSIVRCKGHIPLSVIDGKIVKLFFKSKH